MENSRISLFAIKVHQWLQDWDNVQFSEDDKRRKPEPHFYMFTLPASDLRQLSGVNRRSTENAQRRTDDLGIQRRHDPERSKEIERYIRNGFPWSKLSQRKQESGSFDDFKKPGWLPTAVIVNILEETDSRRDNQVHQNDLIQVEEIDKKTSSISLPENYQLNQVWRPNQLPPIEVIDGQHRLWAFGDNEIDGDYELPVVAFKGLDISWQAYLFWTINIKPVRINPSLAFDMYPLLRKEDWLDKFEGHPIYRETRAQELVEALWSYPESPWYQRINMLGESGKGQMVTQAAWIKSLMTTYVKSWEGRGVSIGGLFGSPAGSYDEVLPWSRTQQSAFLIYVWQELENAILQCNEPWAESLRRQESQTVEQSDVEQLDLDYPDELAISGPARMKDLAFSGSFKTHLNTNIGSRGVLYITNDFCYVNAEELDLWSWYLDESSYEPSKEKIGIALTSLRQHKISGFIQELALSLAKFDWRSSSALNLTPDEKQKKAAIRGGAGFKELRIQLLKHLSACDSNSISSTAKQVVERLGYGS